jgi:MFS family permease
MVALFFLLHIKSPERNKVTIIARVKEFDPIGVFFFFSSMVCLILALQWGGSTSSWSAPRVIGLLVAFGVLTIIFVVIEVFTPETAIVPTRIVLNRSVAGSMLFMFLLSGGLMSVIYYLSVWFQAAKGDSATNSGIHSVPLVTSFIIFGIVAGVFTQKVGYYVPAMLLSPIFCSIGAGMLSTLSPNSNAGRWIGYQLLYGFGVGLGFQTSTLVAQTVLSEHDVSTGLALMFLMQQLGGSVFLSVAQNIFSNKLVRSLSGVADLDAKAIVNTGATNLRKIVPPSELKTVISVYSYALTRVFILTVILSACMLLCALTVEWRSIKQKKGNGSPKWNVAASEKEGESDHKI